LRSTVVVAESDPISPDDNSTFEENSFVSQEEGLTLRVELITTEAREFDRGIHNAAANEGRQKITEREKGHSFLEDELEPVISGFFDDGPLTHGEEASRQALIAKVAQLEFTVSELESQLIKERADTVALLHGSREGDGRNDHVDRSGLDAAHASQDILDSVSVPGRVAAQNVESGHEFLFVRGNSEEAPNTVRRLQEDRVPSETQVGKSSRSEGAGLDFLSLNSDMGGNDDSLGQSDSKEIGEYERELDNVLKSKGVVLDDVNTPTDEMRNMKKSVAEAQRRIESLLREIDACAMELETTKAELLESHRAKSQLLKDLDASHQSLAELKESRSLMLEEHLVCVAALEDQIERFKAQLKEVDDLNTITTLEMHGLRSLCDDKENQLQAIHLQVQKQVETIQIAALQIEELGQQLDSLNKEKEELKQDGDRRFDTACAQLNELESHINELQGEVADPEEERDYLNAEVGTQQIRLESALTQLNEMESTLRTSQEDLAAAEFRIEVLEGRIRVFSNDSASILDLPSEKQILEKCLAERALLKVQLEEKESILEDLARRETEQNERNLDLSGRIDVLETTISLLETSNEGMEGELMGDLCRKLSMDSSDFFVPP
jgi:chromosome segregation ATPase